MKILRSSHGSLDKKHIFIGVPTTGPITAETCISLFNVGSVLARNDIGVIIEVAAYDCHVDDQRNYLVRDFLESRADTFVFIDSDLVFDESDFMKLISYDESVVAGVYPKKEDRESYPVRFFDGMFETNENDLAEVAGVPTGFLKINRSVFEILDVDAPHYLSAVERDSSRRPIPLIFERKLDGSGTRWGGDYQFCELWKQHGGKIYINPTMRFGHVGSNEYTGSVGHWLARSNGLSDDFIVDMLCKLKNDNNMPAVVNELWHYWDNEYSAPVAMLVLLASIIEPGMHILEYGSGLTTLISGALGAHVTSFENDNGWADRVEFIAGKAGIKTIGMSRCKIVDGWYEADLGGHVFDVVIVDGPSRKLGDRYKIKDYMPVLNKKAVVIIDDINTGYDLTNLFNGVTFKRYGRFAMGVKND